MKEVTITILVEQTELDKNAQRLRFTGKITDGRPLEYVRLGSYHTINAALGDVIDIEKERWPSYLINVIRNAVSDSRKPKLGIVAMDDEKAQPACLLGYGVELKSEIYSRLSKRMSQKDFQEQQNKYFASIFSVISTMDVSTVIVAGPGFTKDEFKRHIEDSGMAKKLNKKLIYMKVSNAESSGVYELIRSDAVASILQNEHIRHEFMLMEGFLNGLASKASKYGLDNVGRAMGDYEAETILVNDSMLGDADVQKLLSKAELKGVRVEVFSSEDEVGQQLHAFKDIACTA
jgi:protein pelota